MNTLTRNDIYKLALNNKLLVTFTKVNGDKRTMKCTLLSKFLPAQTDLEESVQRKVSTDNLSVWDIDAKGWRSFRVNSVTSVETLV